MKTVFTLFIVITLASQSVFAVDGQSGNGDFAYKDKDRLSDAFTIIQDGRGELLYRSSQHPEAFADLSPSVDPRAFFNIVTNVASLRNETGFRTREGKLELLMLDYTTDCTNNRGYGCIVIYAPMIIALMYINDKEAAKRFFQTELIHEILHHFNYNEAQAEATAPVIYQRLFGSHS